MRIVPSSLVAALLLATASAGAQPLATSAAAARATVAPLATRQPGVVGATDRATADARRHPVLHDALVGAAIGGATVGVLAAATYSEDDGADLAPCVGICSRGAAGAVGAAAGIVLGGAVGAIVGATRHRDSPRTAGATRGFAIRPLRGGAAVATRIAF